LYFLHDILKYSPPTSFEAQRPQSFGIFSFALEKEGKGKPASPLGVIFFFQLN